MKPVSANSVAVLPFVNMSSDAENEYFSDGITEEIINVLTKIEGLHVTARTSSFFFKGKNQDIRHIGKQLGVETVLEGSVRKVANRVRISAQLINVEDGYHLWSEHYDRQLEDVFAVQDEISLKIAENLKPRYAHSKLSEAEAKAIDQRLIKHMEVAKSYLDNQLSLRQLADCLEVNTNYLSQVINEQHGKNFFEFINEYRVDALKEKLEKPENRQFTILSLAFESGFNSKTTFNTAFKRITGFTPSQYLKMVG